MQKKQNQRQNVLEPLCGKPKKFMFAVFDIEADNWTDLIGIGFYDGMNYQFFETAKEFLDYVLTRKYANHVIFAHFGGGFDFSFLLDEITKDHRGFIPTMNAGEGGIWHMRFKRIKTDENGKDKCQYQIRFSDSLKLLPMSLQKLGIGFNVEHKKIELPIEKYHTMKDGYHEFSSNMSKVSAFANWKDYLKNDCMCLYECIERFYDMVNAHGGTSKFTLASTAMDIFRRRHLNCTIPNHLYAEPYIRHAYYGGRCEVFKRYGENLNYYDFNSLYPFIMKKYKMPIGSIYSDRDIESPGFSLVKAGIGNCNLPILPARHEGKLIFPIGKFEGWYDNELLRYAVSNGYSIHIERSLNFDRESSIFSDFVKDWYSIKEKAEKEKNESLRLVAKLILNSLYGKFGQRREIETLEILDEMKEGTRPYNEDYGMYMKDETSRATFILPWISAHVTAMAGVELHKKMTEAQDVYYCDTDSIVTSSELDTGTALGELKLEHRIEKGYFLLPKVYAVLTDDSKTIIKAKGFSQELREIISFNDIAKAGTDCFKERKEDFLSIRESLRRMKSIVSKAIVKRSIQKSYSKRIMIDSINTVPIRLG